MSLTAGQLLDQIKHRIGGKVAAEIGGGISLVNRAGRHMYSMHGWRSAERYRGLGNYVAGTPFVLLASNFMGMVAIEQDDALGRTVEPVGPGEMLRMRHQGLDFGGVTVWVSLESTVNAANEVRWRLGVYPTPTDSVSEALVYVYKSGWGELTGPDDHALVAPHQEELLIQLVRDFAAGYELDDLEERLLRTRTGEVFRAAARNDGIVQRQAGPLRGGMLHELTGPGWWDWARNEVTWQAT